MDTLKDTISNLTLYDVKAYVRKAQNVVMNYTPMEAKVREATNNEPWGASSTLMLEIAEGTHSYSQFHEIMPMIYKRFAEKASHEWRQIYKSLQLLEFLIKQGSERVVDYARSHVGAIEILKHFHYIDETGKDQGINIRNRAKELATLVSDIERIRVERKKARQNRTKYGGVGNRDAPGLGFGGSGKKYGGFGSDSLEFGARNHSNRVFGDGGGFDGSNYSGPHTGSNGLDDFDEYHVPEARQGPSRSVQESTSTAAPAAQIDLLSLDDDLPVAPAASTSAPPLPSKTAVEDDDFDDFQSASPLPGIVHSQTPITPAPLSQTPITPAPLSQTSITPAPLSQSSTTPAAASGDVFESLWTNATQTFKSSKAPPTNSSTTGTTGHSSKASLAQLAQQSAQKSMWSASSSQQGSTSPSAHKKDAGDDLLSF